VCSFPITLNVDGIIAGNFVIGLLLSSIYLYFLFLLKHPS